MLWLALLSSLAPSYPTLPPGMLDNVAREGSLMAQGHSTSTCCPEGPQDRTYSGVRQPSSQGAVRGSGGVAPTTAISTFHLLARALLLNDCHLKLVHLTTEFPSALRRNRMNSRIRAVKRSKEVRPMPF